MLVVTQTTLQPWSFKRFMRYYRLVELACQGNQQRAAEMAEESREKRYQTALALWRSGKHDLGVIDRRTELGYICQGLTLALFEVYGKYGNFTTSAWRSFQLHMHWVFKRWVRLSACQESRVKAA